MLRGLKMPRFREPTDTAARGVRDPRVRRVERAMTAARERLCAPVYALFQKIDAHPPRPPLWTACVPATVDVEALERPAPPRASTPRPSPPADAPTVIVHACGAFRLALFKIGPHASACWLDATTGHRRRAVPVGRA